MADDSFRGYSRREYCSSMSGGPTTEEVGVGALQRIADATEKMALRYTELVNANDILNRRHKELTAQVERLSNSNAALRGVITKLKQKTPEVITRQASE